jgi:predicted phage tail component-like protein
MALTNTFGFSIGGIHSSNFNIRVYDIKRNILPEITENLLNIPARKGSYFTGLTVAHRVIQVDINIVATSHADRLNMIEGIAYWLLNNADSDQEIIFDDDVTRVYYGHIANSTAVTRGLFNGKATLEIHCSDPFAYGTSDQTLSADSTGLFMFNNNGSADIYPVFTHEFSSPASFLSVLSPNGAILVGNPADGTKTNLAKTQYILNDTMQDVATWTNTGITLDTGKTNTGAVSQSTTGMAVSSFGTGTGWHGPAVRKNLASTVQDFTVKAKLKFGSHSTTSAWNGSQYGAIDIYLFDSNNVKVGKITISDTSTAYEYNVPNIVFGDNTSILSATSPIPAPTKITQKAPVYYTVKKGDNVSSIAYRNGVKASDIERMNNLSSPYTIYPNQKLKIKDGTSTKTVFPTTIGNYNDFEGQLTIQRIGTTWYAEVKRTDMGTKTYLQSKTYYDPSHKHSQNPVAYIVINFLAYGSNATMASIEVDNLQVIQNNTVDTTANNETIFQSGDELVIDCTDSSVWLNGDLFMNHLDIGSTFFSIPPSTTEVKVLTDASSATHSATYTPRYL